MAGGEEEVDMRELYGRRLVCETGRFVAYCWWSRRRRSSAGLPKKVGIASESGLKGGEGSGRRRDAKSAERRSGGKDCRRKNMCIRSRSGKIKSRNSSERGRRGNRSDTIVVEEVVFVL